MDDFKKIAFGFSSAEAERSNDPGLLTDGYIDYKAASEEATRGPKYLFLGYKGAGKSMIGERIRLSTDGSYSEFAKIVPLSDFPFTPFSKIIRGDAEPETKYPTAWSWILLIYLLESFAQDESITHPNYSEYLDSIRAFRKMGLSPAASPAAIVRASAKNTFRLALPGKLAEYEWAGEETRPAAEIPNFVENLKNVIAKVRTKSRHILIIDGLDDVLTSREVQFKSLSALIFEVARLNDMLRGNGVSAKIILLCRTDVFERIPGANKNKIRQDYAVELDWYHDPREPDSSLLVQLAQIRALRSIRLKTRIFDTFFAAKVKNIETARYLLDMTRHTPRDFLQLLTHVQEFFDGGLLNESAVSAGMREYSIKYFLPEIRDELSGYATPDEISQLIRGLSNLRKRDFKIEELIHACGKLAKPLSKDRTFEMLETLFDCSAIGNIQYKSNGNTFYTFKFRNRHSSLNEGEHVMLHRGLWKALNLI